MQKYILYCGLLCVENVIDIADTQTKIIEKQKMAKIFKRMIGQEKPQMTFVELSEEELKQIMKN
jgi:hypothetical protein